MKTIIVLLILPLSMLSPLLKAAGITYGNNSPIVKYVMGNVEINYGINEEELVNFLNSSSLVAKYKGMSKEMGKLREATLNLDKEIQKLREDKKSNKRELETLGKLLESYKIKKNEYKENLDYQSILIASELSRIPGIVDKSVRSVFEAQFQKALKDETQALYSSITEMQNDIDELYKIVAFLKGNSKGYMIFFGPSVGALNIDGEWQRKYGLEIDILLPATSLFSQSSAFVEIVVVDWDKTLSFSTLPGLPDQTFPEDNSFTYVGLGGKVFFYNIKDRYQLYTGVSIGTSIDNENTYYYSLLLGSELYLATTRIVLELRYDVFNNIEEKTYKFNPFGNAETGTMESREDGFYIGMKILIGS